MPEPGGRHDRVSTQTIVALATPFGRDGAPDHGRVAAHVQSLAARGVDAVLVAGTTGEGPSLSVVERRALTEAGIRAASRLPVLVATGCASLTETIELTAHALTCGAAGVLIAPPFFFKEVSEEGLLDYYRSVLDRAIPDGGRLFLYHVPQETMVPISFSLVERVRLHAGSRLAGIKDSEGDLDRLCQTVARFPTLRVLTGAEPLLGPFVRAGGTGAISGLANVVPDQVAAVVRNSRTDTPVGARAQATLTATWEIVTGYRPYAPAIKALLARQTGDQAWAAVRPPLRQLPESRAAALAQELHAHVANR